VKIHVQAEFTKRFGPEVQAPDANSAMGQNLLGLKYYHAQKYRQAEEYYLNAIQMEPDFGIAYSNLCLCYKLMRKYKQAIECGQRAVELLGQSGDLEHQANAYNSLALCYQRIARYKNASQMINKAIEIDPQKPLYRSNLRIIQVSMVVWWLMVAFAVVVSVYYFVPMLFAWLSQFHF
jgi:tetratricopeptide (TPR) repeat protein